MNIPLIAYVFDRKKQSSDSTPGKIEIRITSGKIQKYVVEKPREFDPRGQATMTPAGKNTLTPYGKIKMTPENDCFSGAFL